MKKTSLFLFAATSLLLSGCGNVNSKYLQVKVVHPDGTPETNVKVQWYSKDTSSELFSTNSKGIATAKGFKAVEGETYSVRLSLPTTSLYTYNPNSYTQSLGEDLTISLDSFDVIKEGEGSKTRPYQINTGIYRVPVTEPNEKIYYEFLPTMTGSYCFESWVENQGSVKPLLYNLGYKIAPFEGEPISQIGDNNVNFKYEFNVYDYEMNGNEIINSILLAASSNLSGVYTMKVSRTGDIQEEEDVIVDAPLPTNLTKCEITGDSIGDIGFENGPVADAIKGSDGYYHLDNEAGPIVMVNMGRQGSGDFVGDFTNIPTQILLDGGKVSYNKFVSAYIKYLNSDGLYPLTDELKTFLIKFAETQGLFESNGFIASWYEPGYDFGPGANYMYGCSYYKEAGDFGNPYVIKRNDENATFERELKENERFYFKVISEEAEELTLTPDENTVIRSYGVVSGDPKGDEYTSENPFIKSMSNDETVKLVAYRKDGSAGKISFTYTYPIL